MVPFGCRTLSLKDHHRFAVEPAKRLSLTPDQWFDRIRSAETRLSGGELGIEEVLRQSFFLSLLAPGPMARLLKLDISETQFEEWLGNGQFVKAAFALITKEFSVTLNRPDGFATAEISASVFGAAAEAGAKEDSVALLLAWLRCLLDLGERAAERPISPRGLDQHTHLSERHPPLTQH